MRIQSDCEENLYICKMQDWLKLPEMGRNQFYDSNIEIICTHPDIKINIFDVARSELTIS